MGYWVIWLFGYLVIKLLGYWVIGLLGYWVIEFLRNEFHSFQKLFYFLFTSINTPSFSIGTTLAVSN